MARSCAASQSRWRCDAPPVRRLRDRIGILIERNNIGARFQDRFAVSPAAASRIQHQGASARHQQRNRLAHEHRAMINEFFPILCFLFEHVWSGGEPNRTFKEQSTHLSYKPMTLATCW